MGKLTFGQTGLSYQCDKVELKVEGAPKCPRCHQRVYFTEEKKAAGKTWHAKCFTCGNCKKALDTSNYNQHNGEQIYCTNCYRKFCGPQVYGFVSGAVLPTTADFDFRSQPVTSGKLGRNVSEDRKRSSSISDVIEEKADSSEGCGRCGKRVFFAEEVRVGGKKWHKYCLRCGHCSKSLELGKCSGHDGDLFCQSCYARFFGPRGYGYAAGNGSIFSPDVEPEDYSHSDASNKSFSSSSLNTLPYGGTGKRNGSTNDYGINKIGYNSLGTSYNGSSNEYSKQGNEYNKSKFEYNNTGLSGYNNNSSTGLTGIKYNGSNFRYKYNENTDKYPIYQNVPKSSFGSNSDIYNNKNSNNNNLNNTVNNGFQRYGPITNEWTEYSSLPTPRM